jgi:hypothetical protein
VDLSIVTMWSYRLYQTATIVAVMMMSASDASADADARASAAHTSAAPARLLRTAPALAALVYPGLVWSGPAVWPPLLATALLAPAVAIWALIRLPHTAAAPRAVALAAVAAPPMFSLLGGLLDFQHALPLSSVRVWNPLWLALAALAWREPPRVAVVAPARPAGRSLASLHGISAVPIILFSLAHVMNHVTGVAGGAVHGEVMRALRVVYRHPYIEPVLLACVAVQVVSGLILVGRRLRRPLDRFAILQTAAGAYLAMFFASHVTAALRLRARGGDPDWAWLTGGPLFTDPWSARLVPYYALVVFALAVHLACAVRGVAIGHGARAGRWSWLLVLSAGLATIAATLILVGLARAST